MRWHENWHCVVDSLGLCKLEGIAIKPLLPRHFQRMLAAATGWDVSVADLERIGERIWNLERLFNVREGMGRSDDLPPRRLLEEPIATGPARGERLDRKSYEQMLTEYYRLRGWDPETGVPTGEKCQRVGPPLSGGGASRPAAGSAGHPRSGRATRVARLFAVSATAGGARRAASTY